MPSTTPSSPMPSGPELLRMSIAPLRSKVIVGVLFLLAVFGGAAIGAVGAPAWVALLLLPALVAAAVPLVLLPTLRQWQREHPNG